MMWARIEGDYVAEITDIDPKGRFHESLKWVACDSEVVVGLVYRNGAFVDRPGVAVTPEQIRAQKIALVQDLLDATARSFRYDDIKTAVTYADESAVSKFQVEGLALRSWRSLVWERCYQILEDVLAGTRDIPTDEELIAELPPLGLPLD